MTIRMKAVLQISALVILMIAFALFPAFASDRDYDHKRDVDVDVQKVVSSQKQNQSAVTSSVASAGADASSGAYATNDGNDINSDTNVSTEFNSENNSANVVLVPNNNTENCLRVWGISFGNGGSAGSIGVPWRSKKCDYEQAADDAFAAGERELGWFWKCENPNLFGSFRIKGDTAAQAKQGCLDKMLGGVTAVRTINTLTEKLTLSEDLRLIERDRNRDAERRITEMCDESKNRILAACQK